MTIDVMPRKMGKKFLTKAGRYGCYVYINGKRSHFEEASRMFNQCQYCLFGFDHPTTARCSSNFDIYPASLSQRRLLIAPSITEKLPVPVSDWLDKWGCSRNQYRRILNVAEYNEQFDGPLEEYKDRAVRIANRGR